MDLLAKAIELVENTKQFAKNHGVDNVYCFLDFIPDEILSIILYKADDINISATSKRLNNIYLSNCSLKINEFHHKFIETHPNWLSDILRHKNIIGITKRALILGLSLADKMKFTRLSLISMGCGKYRIEYQGFSKSAYKYDLHFPNEDFSEFIITKNRQESIKDVVFNHNEVLTAGGKFSSIGANISGNKYYVCTKLHTPFYAVNNIYVFISDGFKYLILKTKSLSSYTFNGLAYLLPKRDHPNYREFMEIINGDNSPIASETFDYMPY
ncbi:hypothetical protein PV-S19_0162 [Pacmanvirus S19]|nr:hypothetical protein PV-S19_0162 [Pacmanvirus S19]